MIAPSPGAGEGDTGAIDRIEAATLLGALGHHDVALAGGRVTAADRADDRRPDRRPHQRDGPEAVLRVAGRAVLPAFVDAHVHLDKAHQLEAGHALHAESCAGPLPTDVEGVIELMGRLRSSARATDVLLAARRTIDQLVRHGTTAARVQVEVGPAVGLDLVELQLQLAASVAHRIELQLVAFPQGGLAAPGMPALLADAVAAGLDVVGGCPYVDPDPAAHLDIVFGVAERYQLPVDLHLDFGDNPARSLIGLVAERTRALGMQGRVTIGHVTTLASMDTNSRARALDLLADAGISLVVMPVTDLHLTGHGDPGFRSVAPVDLAAAAGVRVAISNNNVANPFAPFGNANLLQAAWLAGVMRRSGDPESRRLLLDAITSAPASILGLAPHGPVEGADAHLVVLDTLDPDTAILDAPTVLATIRAGRLVEALVGVTVRGSTAGPQHLG